MFSWAEIKLYCNNPPASWGRFESLETAASWSWDLFGPGNECPVPLTLFLGWRVGSVSLLLPILCGRCSHLDPRSKQNNLTMPIDSMQPMFRIHCPLLQTPPQLQWKTSLLSEDLLVWCYCGQISETPVSASFNIIDTDFWSHSLLLSPHRLTASLCYLPQQDTQCSCSRPLHRQSYMIMSPLWMITTTSQSIHRPRRLTVFGWSPWKSQVASK
jgi:hypothetical protein